MNRKRKRTIRVEITAKTLLTTFGAIAAVWVVLKLAPVLLVIVMALVLVGTLNPAVDMIERRGVGRTASILLVFASLFLGVAALLVLTVPSLLSQTLDFAAQMPAFRDKLALLAERSRLTAPIADSMRELHYASFAKTTFGPAFRYSWRAVETIAYVASTISLALYMMIDRDRLRGGLFAIMPRAYHIRLTRVTMNLETIVGGYVRAQLTTSALLAAYTFVLLTVCRVPNALTLAFIAGIFDVLPYIGVFLSVGPAVIAALSRGPTTAIIVACALLFYEEIESRILLPRIQGRALRLPSSIVLIALLAGATVMGPLGAILALPLAAAIRMLVEELRVELPGESQVGSALVHATDARAEWEYEKRAEGVPVAEAAAIAVEITEHAPRISRTDVAMATVRKG